MVISVASCPSVNLSLILLYLSHQSWLCFLAVQSLSANRYLTKTKKISRPSFLTKLETLWVFVQNRAEMNVLLSDTGYSTHRGKHMHEGWRFTACVCVLLEEFTRTSCQLCDPWILQDTPSLSCCNCHTSRWGHTVKTTSAPTPLLCSFLHVLEAAPWFRRDSVHRQYQT